MITPEQIIATAQSYIGVRWHHQGRNRAGVDCLGLVVCTALDNGIPAQDRFGYARQPDGKYLEAELDAQLIRIAEPEPACVLMMRFHTEPQHVAIMADNGDIIHAYALVRKVVRHRLDVLWASRIVACYRFPGVAHV